jgi:predicted RNase H-like nuclease
MRFLGVDLAWGGRRPSGLAVLDPDGRVVDEGWATADDELLGFLAAHDAGGAVLALDAPLVVTNPAGTSRACEAELQRRYGRLGAGPYPVNLGVLGGRVRAMELGRLEGLRGAGLKAVEDLADAHVCAYVGLWWWANGRAATLVAGDDHSGAILVPRPGRPG